MARVSHSSDGCREDHLLLVNDQRASKGPTSESRWLEFLREASLGPDTGAASNNAHHPVIRATSELSVRSPMMREAYVSFNYLDDDK